MKHERDCQERETVKRETLSGERDCQERETVKRETLSGERDCQRERETVLGDFLIKNFYSPLR